MIRKWSPPGVRGPTVGRFPASQTLRVALCDETARTTPISSQAADASAPAAKELLDLFADALADRIAGVPSRPPINGAVRIELLQELALRADGVERL